MNVTVRKSALIIALLVTTSVVGYHIEDMTTRLVLTFVLPILLAGLWLIGHLISRSKTDTGQTVKEFASILLIVVVLAWAFVYLYFVGVFLAVLLLVLHFLSHKKIRAIDVSSKCILIVTVCLVVAWASINLYIQWQDIGGNPYSPQKRARFYPQIKERFTGHGGEFDYRKFETWILAYFESLNMEEGSQNLDFGNIGAFFYVYFIETRPTEEVGNLIPVLKKHVSSSKPYVRFGGRVGEWPGRGYATGGITLGHVCTEVLTAHQSQ